MKFLDDSQLKSFQDKGYVKVPEVFDRADALKLQEEIWEEFESEFGILKEDKTTWKTPPHSPKKAKESLTNTKVITSKFTGIINDLLGEENWKEPEDNFTAEQWESLKKTLEELLVKYPDAQIVGHYMLDESKTCPNFNVRMYLLEEDVKGYKFQDGLTDEADEAELSYDDPE